jgi:maltooligosyltrehalose trehalohydrolase
LDRSAHADHLDFYRRLIAVRRKEITPLLVGVGGESGVWTQLAAHAFAVQWMLARGTKLTLAANLSDDATAELLLPDSRRLWLEGSLPALKLGPWTVLWTIGEAGKVEHG